ncbi:hypothetical protein V6N11_072532 [Hibiscus sabdariffa]|uniref:Uncharacterized protein n=1 Tax=Hibiscus sabdariffa TaxID=183260 RepID=A0ABR2U3B4_9ROSI
MNLNMVIFSYVIFLKTVKVDQANSSNAGVGSAAKTVRQREEDPLDDEVVIIENNNGNQTSFKVELMDGSMKSVKTICSTNRGLLISSLILPCNHGHLDFLRLKNFRGTL